VRRLAATIGEEDGPIRIVPGPQDDLFTPAGVETFLSSEFVVSPLSDRMGVRLQGPRIAHATGYNIVSDGVVAGHVQIPGDGQPIVLMRDRQTTGGYPKIATVISADLDRFAQMRPGTAVRFRAVDVEAAVAALRDRAAALGKLMAQAAPLVAEFDSEALLAANLIGGVVAGDEE
jgi:allophanate hydrolase subunit 2